MNSSQKATPKKEEELVRFAAIVSAAIGTVLLAIKFWAFYITHSEVIFADAMESIVNVVAAFLALIVVVIAGKPADRKHPYGHGKIEFFSAAFEGGLIAFASILIWIEAIKALLHGHAATELGVGLWVTATGGLVNAALGIYLLQTGRKVNSSALKASGEHVLSDSYSSCGVIVGLVLTKWLGFPWIDPVAAILLGLVLAFTGVNIVKDSIGGLLDAEDLESLRKFAALVERDRPPGMIQIHHVRLIRSGRYHHIDAHMVVPEYWDIAQAHDRVENFENQLLESYPYQGELHLHIDPCRRAYCKGCDEFSCQIRREAFVHKRALSLEELISPEEPSAFRRRFV